MAKPTLILGVGNILLSDEGAGVHLVRRLEREGLPEEVEVLDGGTAGLDLLDHLYGRRRLVLVDCVAADEPPGTIISASPDELGMTWGMQFSAHQTGLREVLAVIRHAEPGLEVVVIGIVPENAGTPGMDLSDTVAGRMDRLEAVVRDAALRGLARPREEGPPLAGELSRNGKSCSRSRGT